jgi:hypothetical protein
MLNDTEYMTLLWIGICEMYAVLTGARLLPSNPVLGAVIGVIIVPVIAYSSIIIWQKTNAYLKSLP